MAHFVEHCRDCERVLGEPCEDVNHWLDEWFRKHGPRHRFVRHHEGGVREAYQKFGERGRKAAIIHILKDCGHIPSEQQWKDQDVDILGMLVDGDVFGGYWDPQQFAAAALKLVADEELAARTR